MKSKRPSYTERIIQLRYKEDKPENAIVWKSLGYGIHTMKTMLTPSKQGQFPDFVLQAKMIHRGPGSYWPNKRMRSDHLYIRSIALVGYIR